MRTIFSLCCSLLAIATIAARTSRVPKQVDAHFRFQETVVTLHQPVVVFFEVHNGLSQPITVTVGALVRQFFDFTLTTPNGQIFHKELPGGQVDTVTVGDGKITVAPGADTRNHWS